MYLVAVLYSGGCLSTITATRSEAVTFVARMKERLKKANENSAKGLVFALGEAVEVL